MLQLPALSYSALRSEDEAHACRVRYWPVFLCASALASVYLQLHRARHRAHVGVIVFVDS